MNKPNNFEARAIAAYYRSAKGGDYQAVEHPDAPQKKEHDGKQYIVLTRVNEILAVYRITTQETLKALRRWPKEIEQQLFN